MAAPIDSYYQVPQQEISWADAGRRAFWLGATAITSYACVAFWKGVHRVYSFPLFFAWRKVTVLGIEFSRAYAKPLLIINAVVCLGLAAISLIELTRPATILSRNISERQ